jgi:acetyltransferase-like isoleucine patch superfamily enzyme
VNSLKQLIDTGVLLGEWDPNKVSGLEPKWFVARQFDMLDMRGDLQIRSQDVLFGRHIRIITASHEFIKDGFSGALQVKKCWIDHHAFVGSYAILYNCVIGHHAVVSVGSVVSSMLVPPYCMVEGNPARIVREYREGRWRECEYSRV